MQDLGQPIFYEIPKFHTSLLWCLPFDYEANNFSKNQDSNKVNIIEKRFDVIIKELNKEFRLAIENEEVRQDNEKITIKFHRSYCALYSIYVKHKYTIDFYIDHFQLDVNGFWVSTLSAKIGNKSYQFDLDA